MMHGVRGFFRFAHIDGLIPADPAVYARLPKVHHDETRTQGLDRLELIRFLQVSRPSASTTGAGVPARDQRAARLRGGRGPDRGLRRDPARAPGAAPGREGQQTRHHAHHRSGPSRTRSVPRRPHQRAAGAPARVGQPGRPSRRVPDGHPDREGREDPPPHQPHSLRHAAITNALDAGVPLRDAQILARHADPRTTEHYDRARGNLDRHGVHFLTAYVAGV